MNESTPLTRLVDAVNREAESLLNHQPDIAGRATAGERLKELAATALAEAEAEKDENSVLSSEASLTAGDNSVVPTDAADKSENKEDGN